MRTYRARKALRRPLSMSPIEGQGRRIKPHMPKHCGCERCVRGLEHLPLLPPTAVVTVR